MGFNEYLALLNVLSINGRLFLSKIKNPKTKTNKSPQPAFLRDLFLNNKGGAKSWLILLIVAFLIACIFSIAQDATQISDGNGDTINKDSEKITDSVQIAKPVDDGIKLDKINGAVGKDKPGVAKVEVKKEFVASGNSVDVSVTPYKSFSKGFNVTIRFNRGQGYVSSFQKAYSVIEPVQIFNFSTNGPVNQTWVNRSVQKYNSYSPVAYSDNTSDYFTFKYDSGDLTAYVPNSYSGTVEYDYYLHASDKPVSDADTVWIDPSVGADVFAASAGTVAYYRSPASGSNTIDKLIDRNTATYAQTLDASTNPVIIYVKLSQAMAVNRTQILQFDNTTSFTPNNYNISASNDNATWTLLYSMVNDYRLPQDQFFVNNNAYLYYMLNVTRWNNGVNGVGGLAIKEWYGYNDTVGGGGASDNNGTITLSLNNGNINQTQNTTATINASATCSGGNCHLITLQGYKDNGPINQLFNTTQFGTPFWNSTGTTNLSCGFMSAGQTCSINLTINLSGSGNYFATFNATSNNTYVLPSGSSVFQVNITTPQANPDLTAPQYSLVNDNVSNPQILDYVQFYSKWTDNIAIDKFIFSWNGTGVGCNVWLNDSPANFISGWANVTKQIPITCLLSQAGGIGYQFFANDSSGNWNNTPQRSLSYNIIDQYPTLVSNSTNVSSPTKGQVVSYTFNLKDDYLLQWLNVSHNMTATGAWTNVTIPLSATTQTASANITMIFGNTTNFCVKPYFSDDDGQLNKTVPQACYTTAPTNPTIVHQPQFVNTTGQYHGYNVSFAADDKDGATTLKSANISSTSGNCNYLTNTTGTTTLNITWNCTGQELSSSNIQINISDGAGVQSNIMSNKYPGNNPTVSWISPTPAMQTTNNNVSLNFSGADADPQDILSYYIYVNGSFNKTTSGNTSINFSIGNYIANVSVYDGALFSANQSVTFDIINYTAPVNDSTAPTFANTGLNATTVRRNDYFTFATNISDNARTYSATFGWNGTGTFVNDTTINTYNISNFTSFESGTTEGWDTHRVTVSQNWITTTSNYSLMFQGYNSGSFCSGSCYLKATDMLVNMTQYNQISFDVNITQSSDSNMTTSTQSGNNRFNFNLSAFNFLICTDSYWVDGTLTCGNATQIYSNNSNGTLHFSSPLNYQGNYYLYFTAGNGINTQATFYLDNINISNSDNRFLNITMTKQNTQPRGSNIQTYVYASDSSGNQAINRYSFNISNTAPVSSNVRINNSPITIQNANLSGEYSDLDNDTEVAVGIQWFIDGQYNKTCDNQTLLLSSNYTGHTSIQGSIRYYDGYDWSNWANSSIVTLNDTTVPALSNNATNQTNYNINDVFETQINATDTQSTIQYVIAEFENPNTIKYNVTLNNASRNSAGDNVKYNLSQTAQTPAGQWYIKFYYSDASGNAASTPNRYETFTVNAPPNNNGGGNNGGGGGGSITYNNNVVINSSFTTKPAAIDTYFAFYSNKAPKSWSFTVLASSPVDKCLPTAGFTCAISGTTSTEVTISHAVSTNDFFKTFDGYVDLISKSNDAFRLPVKVMVFDLGISIPIEISTPSALPNLAFSNMPDTTNPGTASTINKPRVALIIGLLMIPTIISGLAVKNFVRRKKR